MDDLYRKIEALCKERNISITTMCRDSGVSRAPLSDLKMGRSKTLSSATLSKIASYFGVSVDYLLGNEKENDTAPYIEDDSEEFIILNRAAKKMTPENRKKLLEMIKIMFAEDFKEDE